jgi:hypothetical protein
MSALWLFFVGIMLCLLHLHGSGGKLCLFALLFGLDGLSNQRYQDVSNKVLRYENRLVQVKYQGSLQGVGASKDWYAVLYRCREQISGAERVVFIFWGLHGQCLSPCKLWLTLVYFRMFNTGDKAKQVDHLYERGNSE